MTEFHEVYFPHPLYRDENLTFYKAFGKNSIFKNMSWNPFKIYKDMAAVGERLKKKNIENNFIGEGLKTGGIFIFGKDGTLKYAYPEDTGSPLLESEIVTAVEAMGKNGEGITSSEL